MSINIRLDVPALERLIGGDSEIEIQLRQGIVEEFSKHHLLKVLKDESFQKFLREESEAIRRDIEKKMEEHLGSVERKKDYWGRDELRVKFKDDISAVIQQMAEKNVQTAITEAVSKTWAFREKYIETEVNKHLTRLTDEYIKKAVKDKLQSIQDGIASATS